MRSGARLLGSRPMQNRIHAGVYIGLRPFTRECFVIHGALAFPNGLPVGGGSKECPLQPHISTKNDKEYLPEPLFTKFSDRHIWPTSF